MDISKSYVKAGHQLMTHSLELMASAQSVGEAKARLNRAISDLLYLDRARSKAEHAEHCFLATIGEIELGNSPTEIDEERQWQRSKGRKTGGNAPKEFKAQ